MSGYTIFLNCKIEINGQTQEISLGLSGSVDNDQRAYDLAWNEAWVQKYFVAGLFYNEFVAEVNACQIDRAYDNHMDREIRRER